MLRSVKRKRGSAALPRRLWSCCNLSCTWIVLVLVCHSDVQALDLFGRGGNKPTPLQLELLQRAARVRAKLGPSPVDSCQNPEALSARLYFESSFPCGNSHQRGFCNWLLPHRLMVGQYPGQVPEVGGPSLDQVQDHLQRMAQQAKVRLFCSLQTEVPPQADDKTWQANQGMIFLEPAHVRQRFPHPFTHYAPIVRSFCEEEISFLQCPIEDLNVPESQEPLQRLLLQLLEFLDENDNCSIYLHCWGGRGRAGLVGGCLLSLLYPHLTPRQILDWVQTGYASRLGHERMPQQLAVSPQTSTQRAFVTEFIQQYQRYYESSSNNNK